jgi:hypothetical protein
MFGAVLDYFEFGLIQVAAHKRAKGNIRSRLEECLRRGGHLEDVVFKK